VAARREAALQTDLVRAVRVAVVFSQVRVAGSFRSLRTPKPPGTRRRSSGGVSVRAWSAMSVMPWEEVTGPFSGARVTIFTRSLRLP
jgi:hypothetical protein